MGLFKIDEVKFVLMLGFWEICIGSEICYIDVIGSFLIEGDLIDLKICKNFIEECVNKIN